MLELRGAISPHRQRQVFASLRLGAAAINYPKFWRGSLPLNHIAVRQKRSEVSVPLLPSTEVAFDDELRCAPTRFQPIFRKSPSFTESWRPSLRRQFGSTDKPRLGALAGCAPACQRWRERTIPDRENYPD